MTNKVTLQVEKRSKSGKGAAREIRRRGLVPAVIYGNKKDPELITIEPKLLLKQMSIKGFKTRQFELEIKNTDKKELTLCQAIQYDKVKDNPIHVDFLRIDLNKDITVEIPFKFINETTCVGVKKGGVLNIVKRYADVICKASNLIDNIEIDIANLNIAESIHASDIKLPTGLKFSSNEDFTIATIASVSNETPDTNQSVDTPSITEDKATAKEDNATK